MKLYILELWIGDYEPTWKIVGIFDNKEKAEESKLSILLDINNKKKECPPHPSEEVLEINEDLYDEMLEKYYKWEMENPNVLHVNDINIREFELNTVKF